MALGAAVGTRSLARCFDLWLDRLTRAVSFGDERAWARYEAREVLQSDARAGAVGELGVQAPVDAVPGGGGGVLAAQALQEEGGGGGGCQGVAELSGGAEAVCANAYAHPSGVESSCAPFFHTLKMVKGL